MSTSRLFNSEDFQQSADYNFDGSYNKAKLIEEIDNWYFFLTQPSRSYRDLIPQHKVVGHIYYPPQKHGLKWIEMMMNKEEHELKTVEDTLNELKDSVENHTDSNYFKFDNEYYISDGHTPKNYAKYDLGVSVNAMVREYQFDHELFCAYQKLSQYFQISLENPCASDFPRHNHFVEWHLYNSNIKMCLSGRDTVISFCNYFLGHKLDFWQKVKYHLGFYNQENIIDRVIQTSWPLNKHNEYLHDIVDYILSDIKHIQFAKTSLG